MIVAFYEPPENLRTGGLDLAIRTLESHLRNKNLVVKINPAQIELEDERPDVIHLHGLWQQSYIRVTAWCRKKGIPYVVSPHGMLEPWAFRHKAYKKRPYFYALERPLLRGAARLIATAEPEAENLRRLTGHPCVEVIPLSLSEPIAPDYASARRRLGWEENERVLLFLSRIHPKKGLHLLLEALERLSSEVLSRQIRLVIVGEGNVSYVNRLRKKAIGLEPIYKIDWIGPVWNETKWLYFQGADLFCLPTYSENFGLAVLEALQVGTPVLTTRATPWDFLPEWDAGYIVNPQISSIIEGLRYFFKQHTWTLNQREILAKRTHQQFNQEYIGFQYMNLYSILSKEYTSE